MELTHSPAPAGTVLEALLRTASHRHHQWISEAGSDAYGGGPDTFPQLETSVCREREWAGRVTTPRTAPGPAPSLSAPQHSQQHGAAAWMKGPEPDWKLCLSSLTTTSLTSQAKILSWNTSSFKLSWPAEMYTCFSLQKAVWKETQLLGLLNQEVHSSYLFTPSWDQSSYEILCFL